MQGQYILEANKPEDGDRFCPRNIVCYISTHTMEKVQNFCELKYIISIPEKYLQTYPPPHTHTLSALLISL